MYSFLPVDIMTYWIANLTCHVTAEKLTLVFRSLPLIQHISKHFYTNPLI